ncbi:DEKNAAC101023 [Brettanomyces naardenensis]|uniref:DEKNAAC101023 n=1 Tax=Brettanomyces naardenensis TaxID=13370 RepID=A0A448YGS5_BRENA|nr:DEKNAAC101023 [Brettanomyces naardenensis]
MVESDSTKTTSPVPRYAGFIAGVFSGVMKNVVGHPFDSVKVRMQTSEGRFKGPWDCTVKTLKNEGVYGLYKGFTPPLVGWVLMDSVMLGSLHIYRRFLKENFYADRERLPVFGHCVAGLGAGLTVSFVAAPIEQLKARLQVQYDAKTKLYKGPIDCLVRLMKYDGLKTLYKGLIPTMIFRSSFIVWWGSYDIITRWFQENTKMNRAAINFWAGGLSATCFWIAAYPADVVKNVIMIDDVKNPKFKHYSDAVRYIYRERGGLRGFGKGFLPCILRSFPANAAALTAFEGVMRFWR